MQREEAAMSPVPVPAAAVPRFTFPTAPSPPQLAKLEARFPKNSHEIPLAIMKNMVANTRDAPALVYLAPASGLLQAV